jgi:hypothetical protein
MVKSRTCCDQHVALNASQGSQQRLRVIGAYVLRKLAVGAHQEGIGAGLEGIAVRRVEMDEAAEG